MPITFISKTGAECPVTFGTLWYSILPTFTITYRTEKLIIHVNTTFLLECQIHTFSNGSTRNEPPPATSVTIATNFGLTFLISKMSLE